MKKQELLKIAKEFVKGESLKNKQGCYLTLDGSVFYRNYAGLQYARAHAGNTTEVYEFDENAELVVYKSEDVERIELLRRIADDNENKYQKPQLENLTNEGLRKLASDILTEGSTGATGATEGDEDNENDINLDKMSRDELVGLLMELDPTHEVQKENKAQLKDIIVNANTLALSSDSKLISMVRAFNPDMIAKEMPEGEVLRILNSNELKAVVLNLRDEVELDQEISDKLFALGEEIN